MSEKNTNLGWISQMLSDLCASYYTFLKAYNIIISFYMKRIISTILFFFTLCSTSIAQINGDLKIKKLIETTPIKNQGNTSTCWAFATTSFIETEAIRLGHDPIELSPMFYLTPTFLEIGEKYLRMDGKGFFNEGDLTFSVLKGYKQYGAIPEIVYSGMPINKVTHDHDQMNKTMDSILGSVIKVDIQHINKDSVLHAMKTVLYEDIGQAPATFNYKTKNYTPHSFAKENIGINHEDYIEVTSYSHHPFYSKFILETQANWNNNYYLNLPINAFRDLIANALMKGFSLGWDGDISEEGFKKENTKIVLTEKFKTEKLITQEMRQITFDDHTTKDDHNMHIVGLAEDNDGQNWYIIKNSWGNYNTTGGYLYMSEPYLLLKTISVLIHKDAIPKEVKSKIE